jgi:hypothetical protein
MRNLFKFICLLHLVILPKLAFGQAPNKISYQAVIRDSKNNLVADKIISMRISIIEGNQTGKIVYQETQSPKTNLNGLVSFVIGTGTMVTGFFDSIKWGNGNHYIKLETDLTGGTNHNLIGISQLLSVPYALYAENSRNPGPKGEKGEKGDKGDSGLAGKDGVFVNKAIIRSDSLIFYLSDSTSINSGKVIFTYQDKIYLFVEDFGAKPNDITFDNSLPIQNAIDSAIKTGKILYFRKGIYYVKKTVYIRKFLQTEHDEGLKLEGAGINQTIITSLVKNQPMIVMENALIGTGKPIPGYFFKGGYIKNIMFQGTAGVGNCFNISGWWYGLMENVQIRNFGGNGIHMPTRNNFGPPNDPNGNAYTDNYSSFMTIRNSQIDNNEGWAYFDERDNTSSDLMCDKSVFASNGKGGIRFGGQSIRITGCSIAYNGFKSSSGGGLELSVSGNSSHNNYITQVEFDGNNFYHIKMNTVINTTVTNCRFLFHDLIDKTKMSPSNGAILLASDSLYPYANNVNVTNNYIRLDYPTNATTKRQQLYFLRFLSHASTLNITIQNNFFQSLPNGFGKYHDFTRYDYYFTSRLGITQNIIIDDPYTGSYSPSARGAMPPYFDGTITNKTIDSLNTNLSVRLPITYGGLNTLNIAEYISFFDSSKSVFSIPESGYYEINISLGIDSIPKAGTLSILYFSDNSLFVTHSHNIFKGNKDWLDDKLILYCYAGQKINIKFNSTVQYNLDPKNKSKIFMRLVR